MNGRIYETEDDNKRVDDLRDKRAARDQSDLSKVLSMPEGRRLLWKILTFAKVYAPTYSGEAHWETNYLEGRRSVGNLLLKDISPEIELTMKREAANDQLLRKSELEELQNG